MEAIVTHLKSRLASNPAVALKTPMDWQVSGGVVKFQVKGAQLPKLYDQLYSKHRIALAQTASGESAGLRFSPHIYNSLEEMDAAAEAVKRVSS
jgi:selenocysteine lyase/cysteine desulfurase